MLPPISWTRTCRHAVARGLPGPPTEHVSEAAGVGVRPAAAPVARSVGGRAVSAALVVVIRGIGAAVGPLDRRVVVTPGFVVVRTLLVTRRLIVASVSTMLGLKQD